MPKSVPGVLLTLLVLLSTERCRPRTATLRAPVEASALADLRRQGNLLFAAGSFPEAVAAYELGYQKALSSHAWTSAVSFLNNLGSAHFASFEYQQALRAYLEAKHLVDLHPDSSNLGIIFTNLSSLYLQLGDIASSERAAEDGMRQPFPPKYLMFRTSLLTILGELRSRGGRLQEALACFNEAIEIAAGTGDRGILAKAWDHMGEELLHAHRLRDAETALLEAYRLRLLFHDRDLRLSYLKLSELRLAQGDLKSAAVLIDRGHALPGNIVGPPRWSEFYQYGRVRMAQGKSQEAAASFREALRLAEDWREQVVPTDRLRSTSSGSIEIHQIHRAFIEASLAVAQPPFAEAFLVSEDDKSAGLRQTMNTSQAWRSRIPSAYWFTLSKLRLAEALQAGQPSGKYEHEAATLRYKLLEMEAATGLSFLNQTPEPSAEGKTDENSTPRNALLNIQRGLGPREAVLSLYRGETASYLWALTASSIEFHSLANPNILSPLIGRFRTSVESNSTARDSVGELLYQRLFGGLSATVRQKPEWLIAADEAFFDVPFPALVIEMKGGRPVYLLEQHSTQNIPTALMLSSSRPSLSGAFLGIGDGVYNTADPRWGGKMPNSSELGAPLPQLARLPASGQELTACSREWYPSQVPTLLTGLDATRDAFESALTKRPSVIHIAAHFLHPANQSEQTLINLGVSSNGSPELLTKEDISNLRVPGSIVVMSGCSSAASEPLPRAGILGLTRAWLIAGAVAVVGSKWPTPDDTGELFQVFYRDLRTRCDRGAQGRVLGASLQQAQLSVLHSATWRSNPSYWSAFYIVGKD